MVGSLRDKIIKTWLLEFQSLPGSCKSGIDCRYIHFKLSRRAGGLSTENEEKWQEHKADTGLWSAVVSTLIQNPVGSAPAIMEQSTIGAILSAIEFSTLARVNKDIVSIALSYASGAIRVMLAESMISEVFEEGGSKIGLATTAEFAVAFVLGQLGGI